MQGRAYVVGTLGLVLVLGGAMGLSNWHRQAIESERQSLSTPVLVALRGLNQGEAMGPLDFRMRDWPSDALPEGAITDSAGIEGRVLSASVQAGEPILLSKLAAVGALTGLVQRIGAGHRAISLKVNDANAVNGFIQPGHRVDVIAYLPGTASPGLSALGRQNPALTRTLIEDVPVIAVDREAQGEQGRPKSSSVVTLEVRAADVERIEHARQVGSVSLVLRADGDNSQAASRGQTSATLWSNAAITQHKLTGREAQALNQQTLQISEPSIATLPLEVIPKKVLPCIEVFDGLKQSRECLP